MIAIGRRPLSTPSRPSDSVRRAVHRHAAQLAADRAHGAPQVVAAGRCRHARRCRPRGTIDDAAFPDPDSAGAPHRPHRRRHRPGSTSTRRGEAIIAATDASAETPAPRPHRTCRRPKSGAAAENAAAAARGRIERAVACRRAKRAPDGARHGRVRGMRMRRQARQSALPPRATPADRTVALQRAAESGDLAGLQLLLEENAPVDARDSSGRTALMLATLNGQGRAVDALLAHGADPNAADIDGTTPLQAAVAANQPAIAAALRRAGARSPSSGALERLERLIQPRHAAHRHPLGRPLRDVRFRHQRRA